MNFKKYQYALILVLLIAFAVVFFTNKNNKHDNYKDDLVYYLAVALNEERNKSGSWPTHLQEIKRLGEPLIHEIVNDNIICRRSIDNELFIERLDGNPPGSFRVFFIRDLTWRSLEKSEYERLIHGAAIIPSKKNSDNP